MLMPRRRAIWRGMGGTLVPSPRRHRQTLPHASGRPVAVRRRRARAASPHARRPDALGVDRARLGSRLTTEGRAAGAPRVRIAIAPGASVTLGAGVALGEATRI